MQSLAIGGYTKKEVMDILHGRRGPRQLRFRYDLLDKNNQFIKTLTTVKSGEVSMNSLAEIKRTARFSIVDNREIDWISDRIQPFVELKIPEIKRPYTNYEHVFPENLLANGQKELTGSNEFLRYENLAPIFDKHGLVPYTISFDLKVPVAGSVQVYMQNGSGAKYFFTKNVNATTSYQRFTINITPTLSNASLTESWLAFYGTYNTGRKPTVKNVKVQLGTAQNVEYTPAIADVGLETYQENWMKKVIKLETIPSKNIAFPQGIFLLSSPTRKDDTNKVIRDVEAFGGLVILRDDKLETRTILTAGTLYYEAVVNMLLSAGITQYNIEYTDAVLQRDIEFEAGKEKLFVVNELLRQINYTPIVDDVNGIFVSAPYRSPAVRSAEYTYKDDELSVTYQGMEEELDLFNVPNKWVVISSNPEQEPLASFYTNDNPDSPTSTVNRGLARVDHREVTDIADQVTLDAYVQRIAFEASQVYGKIAFETALMPFHDYQDVLEVDYSPLGIKGKYAETSWTMPLSVGGKMEHEVRKVVNI